MTNIPTFVVYNARKFSSYIRSFSLLGNYKNYTFNTIYG